MEYGVFRFHCKVHFWLEVIQPNLCHFKVLYCADVVDVVISNHMTNMAATPFDPV